MHFFLSLLLTLLCLPSSAQLPDLLLKDETGIYKHALDSTIRTIQKEKPLRILFITADKCVSNYLPDTIRHVAIVTNKKKVKRKNGRLKSDELNLTVACGQIIEDQAVVIIYTPEPSKWVFAFHYDFTPDNKQPKLLYVNRGPIEFQ
jgi:hypothetical protein